ncbi:hypothetical protein GGE07_004719 [Sinorhizobium terangae]|uniref:hypothetical protein n=1 Tax=Sinorhizobium terangae TaxID=110322 RepID=UPI0017AC7A32|nr:hypothetical protein [Sinorhizobium terangae]MBB4188043.1 hypothetical protein [Sinorhizobium terangae]
MPNRSTGPAAAMAGASARPRDLRALLKEQAVLMAELDRRRRTNILAGYRPYAKQRSMMRVPRCANGCSWPAINWARRLPARRRRRCT